MVNNTTSTVELMAPWGYTLAAAVLSLIQIFGLFFNLFVIILMLKDKKIWNPINIIVFNLVCSDLSVAILGNPLALTSALSHHWVFGEMYCTMYGFFMALLGINSIISMTVMSFERYIMVKDPFSTMQLTGRSARISIIFIWLYSIAVTCPPLFGWGAYVSEAANISCSVNWEEQTTNAKTYIMYIFFFGLVLPLSVITFCYVQIVLTMKQSASRTKKSNPTAAERKVVTMVFIMISAFMVAWAPYATFSLIKQFGNADWISPGLGVLPSIFAKTSICYNPIIYAGMNSQFRQAYDRLCGRTPVANMVTVTTTANLLTNADAEAKQTIQNRLQTINATIEARPEEAPISIEEIEMRAVGGRCVTIQD